MRIKTIHLDDDGMPESMVVEMTATEALYMAKKAGKESPNSANEFMRNGYEASSGIYAALVGDVFDRFYEGGVDEALRG